MQLTIEIEDADVVRLVQQHPLLSITEIVDNLIQESFAEPLPKKLALHANETTRKAATLSQIAKDKRAGTNTVAGVMAEEMMSHVIHNMALAKTFRPMNLANNLFGDRLGDDRGLRSALGIRFSKKAALHASMAPVGAKIVVPDRRNLGSRLLYVVELKLTGDAA